MRRIETLSERGERRRPEEDRELDVLVRAGLSAFPEPLAMLPARQREWLSLWELCHSQRHGQGMTLGTLVHSEIWNNLEQLGYEGREKERAFRVVLAADEIFRGISRKREEREEGARPT